jgi:serine/threonine-protein kinase
MRLTPAHGTSLTLSQILHVDEICRRFEVAWKNVAAGGPHPVLEAYLADTSGPTRGRLLRELVRLEVYYRALAGELLDPADWQARFPDLDPASVDQALETAGLPARPTLPAALEAGDEADIPGLEILHEVGRGGMGAVFKGRDSRLGRVVAVKVLLGRHQGHPELYSHFLEEARIGGQLQHPGIVPIYALGEAGAGRPWFTMRLVEGHTLADLLRERADPVQELPRYLEVFERVCQTLAYAHSQGVVHRDLKPSNIMVGAFGEVQVMDWGLAGRLPPLPVDESGPPEEAPGAPRGRVLGTPAYMAPEQARGEIDRLDERCDVFGLGALLCEILTGLPPYNGSDGVAAYRQAQEADLADARSRLDGCGADAELVGLARACLAVERDHRPRHAGVVAEAVTAYREGVAERLRVAELARATAEVERAAAQARVVEEGKRRKLTAALGAALLALVLLGGGGAWWLAGKRVEAERAVQQAHQEARGLHDLARAAGLGDPLAWTKALTAAQRADGLLAGAWVSPPLRHEVGELLRQVQEEFTGVERDRELLARLADIRTQKEDDFGLADTDQQYAQLFREQGLDVDSLPAAEAAALIRARSPQVVTELTAALDDWALERRRRRRRPQADWRRLLDLARQADPDPWRQTLRATFGGKDRSAVLRLADQAEVAGLPVQSVELLARVLREAGAGERAEAVLRTALQRHPGDVWLNHALADHLYQQRPPRLDEAIRFYTAARAVRPEVALRLGQALLAREKPEEAVAVFRELTRLRQGNLHPHYYLGIALARQGKRDEAAAVFRDTFRALANPAAAHHSLGLALARRGLLDQAVTAFHEALALKPEAATWHNLGTALSRLDRLDEAVTAYRAALDLEPGYISARHNLGTVLSRLGRFDEAAEAHREVLRRQPNHALAHIGLGLVLTRQGKGEEGLGFCRKAVVLQPDLAEAHHFLGLVLRDQGQFTEALAALKRGRELGARKPDWPFPSDSVIREVEHLIDVEAKLPAFLRGEARFADAAERATLARICHDHKRLHRAAAGLYADAFAAEPALAEDLQAGHRTKAACAAALAGCGQGEDAPPDGPERVRWRRQALEWLRAELTGYARRLEGGKPVDRAWVQQQLRDWQKNPALAGVRGPVLARLPESERDGWRRLWDDVAALLGRVSAPRRRAGKKEEGTGSTAPDPSRGSRARKRRDGGPRSEDGGAIRPPTEPPEGTGP